MKIYKTIAVVIIGMGMYLSFKFQTNYIKYLIRIEVSRQIDLIVDKSEALREAEEIEFKDNEKFKIANLIY